MPTYDYLCGTCNHYFELRQGFDAEPQQLCPTCGSKAQRQFHAVGVIYKGSGFYTTDYKRGQANLPSVSSDGKKDGASTKELNQQIAEVASKED